MNNLKTNILSSLFGVAIGDALGVPVEFVSRQKLRVKPITDMIGYGTHNMPIGTWSDDTSMTLCLADAMCKENFSPEAVAENFLEWLYRNKWTAIPAAGVFDCGMTTENAMENLKNGYNAINAGGIDEGTNGNGSLMRILPLVFHIMDNPIEERFEITKQISSITHGHIRSVIACFYYLEFARKIIYGINKFKAYYELQTEIPIFLKQIKINEVEINIFDNLLKEDIYTFPVSKIFSSGYVKHTLEASIYCLLTTASYSDCVLKAVNLGEDTDTTGAVAGGLAGLLYGIDSIPEKWKNVLVRKDDIRNLVLKLFENIK